MAFGLGRLAWPPDRFWAATPREIDAALRAHGAARAQDTLGRDAMARLMAAHPDHENPLARN